jgi:hypothetical protein
MVRDERRLALVPATDLDADRIRNLPTHWPFQVQTLLTRTSKLNRWYRGGLSRVADGLDLHPQALHCDLKAKAGLIEQVMLLGSMPKTVAIKLRSTAFPEMGDDEFSSYCDFVVPTIFRDYAPGIRARQQQQLVMEWFGRRPRLEDPPKLILPR